MKPNIHKIKLGVCNCYVIRGKSTILVDAGPPRQEKRFIRKILSLGIDGKIFPTPEHSPGSMGLLLGSGDAFVGDLYMNGFPMRRGPGIPIFADDIDTVKRSAKFLMENGVTFIYPGHGEPFNAALLNKKLL